MKMEDSNVNENGIFMLLKFPDVSCSYLEMIYAYCLEPPLLIRLCRPPITNKHDKNKQKDKHSRYQRNNERKHREPIARILKSLVALQPLDAQPNLHGRQCNHDVTEDTSQHGKVVAEKVAVDGVGCHSGVAAEKESFSEAVDLVESAET